MKKKKKEKTRMREKTKKIVKRRHPKASHIFLLATTFTPQPPKSYIKQLSKRCSVTPEKEEDKCDTLTALLAHEGPETLEALNK